MRRDPLLYSDHNEVEDINTIEPIEVKRSFMFYFIVLANTLLVVLVLLIIWSLFTKPAGTSFDQQLKTWTQQVFNSGDDIQPKPVTSLATPMAKQIKLETASKPAPEEIKPEEDLAIKAEKEKLEALAVKLKEEKDKADTIQQSINASNNSEVKTVITTKVIVDETPKEPAVVSNAAKAPQVKPSTTTKTQLEQILETMQNQ